MVITKHSLSQGVLAKGQSFTMNITAKNDMGSAAAEAALIGSISVEYTNSGGAKVTSNFDFVELRQTLSWANGATKALTFTGIVPNYEYYFKNIVYQDAAAEVRYNAITWKLALFKAGDSSMIEDNASFQEGHLLNWLYNPVIEKFSLERCIDGAPNDEGESLLTTMKVSMENLGTAEQQLLDYQMKLLTLKLYYAEGEAATTQAPSIDLTSHISELLTGVTDSAELITDTFANTGNWNFLLVFGDDYESAEAILSIPKAFANVHLSGRSTGGVAFGGFSTSEESAPKFECHYPGYFYGGIQGVNNYSTEEVKTGGTWIDGKPIYRKTYVYEAGASSYATLDLSELDFEMIRIVDFVHHTQYKSAGSYWSGNYYWASGDATRCYVNGTNLILRSGDNITTSTGAWVTVEYTKTTD